VVRCAEEALSGIDIAILNTGGPPPANPLETTELGWRDALQLLLLTPIAVATGLLAGMRDWGFGRIIAVLSSGIRGPVPHLVYSKCRARGVRGVAEDREPPARGGGRHRQRCGPRPHRRGAHRVARRGPRPAGGADGR
jgi:NAD(P)-dependent dehydrogenase (short-subunit alcohol dehydrogenase family)